MIKSETVPNPNGATYMLGSMLFREGDKVIQTRNNYDKDVFNGDLGIIQKGGLLMAYWKLILKGNW